MQKHTYMPKNIKIVRKFNMYPTTTSCACVIYLHIKRFTHLKKSDLFKFEDTYQEILQKIVSELSLKNVSYVGHDIGYQSFFLQHLFD